jgi:hypothetical protein
LLRERGQPARAERKIDATIALIMAIGWAMTEPLLPISIFESLAWDTAGWLAANDLVAEDGSRHYTVIARNARAMTAGGN